MRGLTIFTQRPFYTPLSLHTSTIVTASSPASIKKSINQLQIAQNSAARLLTSSKRSNHITPVLASLHWLPVCFRIDFKILLLTFKALHGLSPCYLSDLLVAYVPVDSQRSSGRGLLSVPETQLKTRGDSILSQSPEALERAA